MGLVSLSCSCIMLLGIPTGLTIVSYVLGAPRVVIAVSVYLIKGSFTWGMLTCLWMERGGKEELLKLEMMLEMEGVMLERKSVG